MGLRVSWRLPILFYSGDPLLTRTGNAILISFQTEPSGGDPDWTGLITTSNYSRTPVFWQVFPQQRSFILADRHACQPQ